MNYTIYGKLTDAITWMRKKLKNARKNKQQVRTIWKDGY